MNGNVHLVVTSDLLSGSSALLPTACTPDTGPANVDGKCIMGGTEVPAGRRGYYVPSVGLQATDRCVAFPVYLATNVPYTGGRVAGSNYTNLAKMYTYTRLNQHWANSKS